MHPGPWAWAQLMAGCSPKRLIQRRALKEAQEAHSLTDWFSTRQAAQDSLPTTSSPDVVSDGSRQFQHFLSKLVIPGPPSPGPHQAPPRTGCRLRRMNICNAWWCICTMVPYGVTYLCSQFGFPLHLGQISQLRQWDMLRRRTFMGLVSPWGPSDHTAWVTFSSVSRQPHFVPPGAGDRWSVFLAQINCGLL